MWKVLAWISADDAMRSRRPCLEVRWIRLIFYVKGNSHNYDIMLTFACGEEQNVKPFAAIAPQDQADLARLRVALSQCGPLLRLLEEGPCLISEPQPNRFSHFNLCQKMAAYTTVYTYRPIANVEVELTSPLSGRVEPLELTLYAYKVESMLYWAVRKSPTASYRIKSTGEEIPAAHWTDEMEAFYKERAAAYTPIPDAGTHLNFFGKMILGLVGLVILSTLWGILSELL